MSRLAKRGFATFSLENLALGLLVPGPTHGYALYQAYEAQFSAIWKVGRSKFYAALAALCDADYLSVHTELQEDRPPRKIYQLTEDGRARFEEWLQQPVTPMRAIRVEFLAKLRFIDLLAREDAARIIDAQIAACQDIADEAYQEHLDGQNASDVILDLVHDFRYRQVLFIIEWLTICRARLVPRAAV